MDELAYQVVVATFDTEADAETALTALDQIKDVMGIQAAAVVERDEADKLHMKEIRDMGGGRGAAIGGTIGAALGLVAGPAGLVLGAGAGAIIGGVVAKVIDGGFKDERLAEFGKSMAPGTLFVVAVVDNKWVAEVKKELTPLAATVDSSSMTPDIAYLLGD